MSAARSSAQSGKPDLMHKYFWTGVLWTGVLLEYGEWWYGTGERCQMRWAGRDTERRDGQEPVKNIRR